VLANRRGRTGEAAVRETLHKDHALDSNIVAKKKDSKEERTWSFSCNMRLSRKRGGGSEEANTAWGEVPGGGPKGGESRKKAVKGCRMAVEGRLKTEGFRPTRDKDSIADHE